MVKWMYLSEVERNLCVSVNMIISKYGLFLAPSVMGWDEQHNGNKMMP